ncbi:hypothetical protein BACCIP111895_01918 [Neobacillus rhizosphaerae]|uniref:Uncharacterized protein n=1 Tax=Neobacillus rhizosphaerae TaxID=2880965 RepID=A0ABN8KMJ7_9BACI|nr:hypothetical protein [Neobacillus rhizosphaerae]CAH2714742.1 hypothetical protein BACCIP111895_01918 [Neobacillus rhizosphaerae]
MKRIIALSSFLFLFLLAVLPANVSHAAAAKSVEISGITLFTDAGEIKAIKKGNNFTFNLIGLNGKIQVKKIEFTSENATTVSLDSRSDEEYSTDTDLRFANGVAYLDKEKYKNWAKRIIKEIAGEDFPWIEDDGTDNLLTVQDLRYIAEDDEALPAYVSDDNGNESEFSVTFATAAWVTKDGKWFYIGPESNSTTDYATGWVNDKGISYYLGKDGVMQTGWVKSENKWYLLKPSGAMATGWVKDKGTWYYLNDNGAMATGWVKDKGTWYYLNGNGTMKTGWVKTSGKWYFLNSNGKMATGWAKVSNKWYYLDGNGVMKTGWVVVSKKWYYLYSDGHMAVNTKIGSHKIGKDGAWIK